MNMMVENLNKFYEEFNPNPDPEPLLARDVSYTLLKNTGFVSPTSFRLPLTINPMLDALLPATPYSTKGELVYELLIAQLNELSNEFPHIDKSLTEASQKALDDFNAERAKLIDSVTDNHKQQELLK